MLFTNSQVAGFPPTPPFSISLSHHKGAPGDPGWVGPRGTPGPQVNLFLQTHTDTDTHTHTRTDRNVATDDH